MGPAYLVRCGDNAFKPFIGEGLRIRQPGT
jgi:hypothetical protein